MKINWLLVNLLIGCLVGWGLAFVDAEAGRDGPDTRFTWRVACVLVAVAILVVAHLP